MNRRQFAIAALGSSSLLVAGQALIPSTFARTRDDRSPSSPADEPAEDLFAHVERSPRRVYEHRKSGDFVVALALEFDRVRNAKPMYDRLVETALSTYEGVEPVGEEDYNDFTDQGYLYTGALDLGDGTPVTQVAAFYARQGKIVYGIAAGSTDDAVAVIDAYAEALFVTDRAGDDLLLTEDEMPRGFAITEETDDFTTDVPEEGPEDQPKKRSGSMQRDIMTAMRMPFRSPVPRF